MVSVGLDMHALTLMRGVLAHYPSVTRAVLFGSRAMGTAREGSDVDLVLEGAVDALGAAAIAEELEELPLTYRFDVVADALVTYPPLRDHIARVGVPIYVAAQVGP
jgi:uncharacterized protein